MNRMAKLASKHTRNGIVVFVFFAMAGTLALADTATAHAETDPKSKCQFSISAKVSPSKIAWEEAEKGSIITGTIAAGYECIKPFYLNGEEIPEIRFSIPVASVGSPFDVSGPYVHPNGGKVLASQRPDEIIRNNIIAEDYCAEAGATVAPEQCLEGWDVSTSNGKNRATCAPFSSSKTAVSKPYPESGATIQKRLPQISQIVPDSIKVDFDPEYVEQTKTERKYIPSKPFSIFDRIQVSLKLKSCNPAYDRLPWSVRIMTTNAKGEEIIISSTYEYDPSLFGTENDIGGFTRVSSMINGNYTYQLSTYPLSTYLSAHISSPDNQEILIDSIAKKRPVFVRIEFKSEKKDIPIEMTNCAQIYGAGEHKIVNMRGKSSASKGLDVASTLDKYRKNGFEQINPLKSYSDSFSYFADLANHDDTKWSMLFGFFTGANNKPREISACGSDASQYFFHTGRLKNRAYAPYGSGVAFSPATITLNAIHEMAHSFVGIEDEYTTGFDVTLYYANCAPPGRAPHWGTIDQSRFSGGNGFYYGDYLKGCQLSSQYRPSADSIMQGLKSTNSQFNVVSCGYFLQAIKKGTASLRSFPMSELIANWEECKKMDGIIKPLLVDADPLIGSINNSTRLLAGISPILTNNGTPDSMIKLNFSSPYITLESFAPDGTITGEVFESANENTPVGKPILNRTTSTAQTSSTLIISKPGIDSLRAMVRDLQAQIQVLRDKIDAIKCSRGLAPCKEKVLIPSKQLLPALPKEQQLGNILNTLQIFIESLSNPKR